MSFIQLLSLMPELFELVSVGERFFHGTPGHGCVSIIHEKFDIFGATCFVPSYCGPHVFKERLAESSFLDSYYLCQRVKEPQTIEAWELRLSFEGKAIFPGYGVLSTIFEKLVILKLGDYYAVMSIASEPFAPQKVETKDICKYNKDTESTFAYSTISRNIQIWDKFWHLNTKQILNLPYALNYEESVNPSMHVSYFPHCEYSVLEVGISTNTTFVIASLGANAKTITAMCDLKVCDLHLGNSARAILPYEHSVSLVKRQGEVSLESRLGTVMLDFLPVLMYSDDHNPGIFVLNGDKICGIHDIETPSYGIPMQYNLTHLVKDNKVVRGEHSYYCDNLITVTTDVMNIVATLSSAMSFLLRFILHFLQEIFAIFRGLFISLDTFFVQILQFIIDVFVSLASAVLYLLFKLNMVKTILLWIITYIIVEIRFRSRMMAIMVSCFAVFLYKAQESSVYHY